MRVKPLGCLAWTVGVSFLLACLLPIAFPLDFILTLALGWVLYLYRVVPEVKLSPDGLATGAVCLTLFTLGTHAFLRWLYREVRGDGAGPWRWKWTGALVAGVVLMFTAGLAATGVVHQTGWMLTSREPWLDSGMMWAARRAQSVNNLKQIGIGIHNDQNGEPDPNSGFPPGLTIDAYGEPLHGWQALILPQIEQQALYNALNFRRPWDDPVNAEVLRRPIQVYLNPGVRQSLDPAAWAPSHYEGNVLIVGRTRPLRIDDISDGTSNTIHSGEVAGSFQPWGKPGHWRDPADGINRSADKGFGGPYPDGANVLMLDGSVKFIKNSISPALLKALSTPAGGETFDATSY